MRCLGGGVVLKGKYGVRGKGKGVGRVVMGLEYIVWFGVIVRGGFILVEKGLMGKDEVGMEKEEVVVGWVGEVGYERSG